MLTSIWRRIPAQSAVIKQKYRPYLQYQIECQSLQAFIHLYSTLPPKPRWEPNDKFDPSLIENGWYEYWDSRGLFEPRQNPTKSQVRMLLPPPNVTGQLHIGHALMISIQDSLSRYYRMQGHSVTWSPGTDHAGIATQLVVERMIEQQRGITRKNMGRESFLKEVEAWREKYGRRILDQMKALGASTTNSQEYYTRDERRTEAVTNAFVELWKEGLIYRNTKMVNWCVKLQTAISDVEVKVLEIDHPQYINGIEFGVLHKFAFPLVEGEGFIEVTTTRPETIPGDRAIAVHPDDERYKHLHYKLAQHPLLPSITLSIIPDAELVDPEFGSGAVKITPAHDIKDHAFWVRHSSSSRETEKSLSSQGKVDIPLVKVISETGQMTTECGIESIVGLDRLHARKRIIALLEKYKVYRGKEDHKLRIGISERSGAVIEPMLQPQWYLKMKPLAKKVFEVANRDGLKIIPENPHSKLWEQWLSRVQDWCLSRQIWWGHQVPAYMVINPLKGRGHVERWLAATSKEDAKRQLSKFENEQGYFLQQDTDVLDTWFSSGLLPLSTVGWIGNFSNQKESDNYPLYFIESGADILFFWLARMAMLCTWFTGKLPFNEILLHPLVCDAQGRKMSKSIRNVIDPLLIVNGHQLKDMVADLNEEFKKRVNVIDKAAYKALRKEIKDLERSHPHGFQKSGADSLRMALVDYTNRYTQINMEIQRVDYFRKLAIKIFNAFKLYHKTRRAAGPSFVCLPLDSIVPHLLHHDKFLLHHLRVLIAVAQAAFTSRRLHEATSAIREFIFNTLCSIYLELVKLDIITTSEDIMRRNIVLSLLSTTWDMLLRLLHPFMPFLTETLWQEIDPANRANIDAVSIINAPYPNPEDLPTIDTQEFQDIHFAFSLIDTLREYGHVKKEGTRITEFPFTIAVPNRSEGRYIYEIFSAIKKVSLAHGAVLDSEDNIRKRFLEDGDWRIVWSGNLVGDHFTEYAWRVWGARNGERVLLWCRDTVEAHALRTALDSIYRH